MFHNPQEQNQSNDSFQELFSARQSGEIPDMSAVLELMDRLQASGNGDELLAGQGFLMNNFSQYPFEDQQHFVQHSTQKLEHAIRGDSPLQTIPHLGFLAIARDFGSAPTRETQEFWQNTVRIVQNLYQEMQQKAIENPSIWRATVDMIGPGMTWLEVPFGTTEETLDEVSTPKLLEDCELTISMRKLDRFINGELGLREFFGPGGEMEHSDDPSVSFVADYDNASSLEEKILIAARYLEAGFAIDMPGEFEVIGDAEQRSRTAGSVPIRCTPRARRILSMAQIVDRVRKRS